MGRQGPRQCLGSKFISKARLVTCCNKAGGGTGISLLGDSVICERVHDASLDEQRDKRRMMKRATSTWANAMQTEYRQGRDNRRYRGRHEQRAIGPLQCDQLTTDQRPQH